MEIEAINQLCCPDCSAALRLEPFATEKEAGRAFVKNGVMLCEVCRVLYPIESDTPVMLRFRTPFHDWFARAYETELRPFSDYSFPRGEARTGEEAIQETFTDEWNLTREDELSNHYTEEQLEEINRKCWLRYLEALPDDRRPRTLLDVGCGAGMETLAVQNVTGAEQVFGIDLNLALLSRRREFRRQPGLNFVISSLFDLPFQREVFDLVYSAGVLHHTYSTRDAFRAISTRVRPGGHLFVWIYGLDDHLTAWGRRWRRYHFVEWVLRPWISRAPRPIRNRIFKLLAPVVHLRIIGGNACLGWGVNENKWTRANTEHQLRDWLSPRYVERHGFNEVTEWFEDEGYRIVGVQSSHEYRKLFSRPLSGVGMTGQKSMSPEREEAWTDHQAVHA